MTVEPWSPDRIAGDVRRLGVRLGDVLMVHASLRAVGPVVGGAEGVLNALASVVGPAGTLFMTLGARDDFGWVNERPEHTRAELLRGTPPFDPLTSPADPDVGVLAEVFRTRAGTLVSDHPEGRMGAAGRLAAELVVDVPWDDYYGPCSPLERFVRRGGRVLRLGADIDTVTLLHYGEYLVDLPAKRRVRRHRIVRRPNGPELRSIECLDDSDGIVDHPGDDYFGLVLRAYLATGRATTGTVGGASSELIDGDDLVDFAVTWMATHLAP